MEQERARRVAAYNEGVAEGVRRERKRVLGLLGEGLATCWSYEELVRAVRDGGESGEARMGGE